MTQKHIQMLLISDSDFPAAVGLHPRHAVDFNSNIKRKVTELLRQDRVVALGEIGLDRTEPKGTWSYQESVLKDLLTLVTPEKPDTPCQGPGCCQWAQ